MPNVAVRVVGNNRRGIAGQKVKLYHIKYGALTEQFGSFTDEVSTRPDGIVKIRIPEGRVANNVYVNGKNKLRIFSRHLEIVRKQP